MARTQQFQLREGVGGLPGEMVCAGCQAPPIMTDPVGDSPTGTLLMTHADGCQEGVEKDRGASVG